MDKKLTFAYKHILYKLMSRVKDCSLTRLKNNLKRSIVQKITSINISKITKHQLFNHMFNHTFRFTLGKK